METLKEEQKGYLTRFHSYIFKDPSRWLMLPFPRLEFAPWEKDACSPGFASSNDAKGRPASAISQKVKLTSSLPPSFFSSFLSSNSYLFYFPGGGGTNTWDLLSSQISSTHYSIINFVSMLYIRCPRTHLSILNFVRKSLSWLNKNRHKELFFACHLKLSIEASFLLLGFWFLLTWKVFREH